MSARSALKSVVEQVLVRSRAADLARAIARSRALILAFHNVVPDEAAAEGDRSLHLPRARFAEQLDLLARTHEVVPLDALLEPGAPRNGRPRIAITFDDAYRGAVCLAVEELARRNLPATIFVAPALLGGRTLWWDTLLASADGTAEERRTHALHHLRGEDAAIRDCARRSGLEESPVSEYAVTASEEELRAALRHPGLELASHSWSHPNLARLTAAELRDELERPLPWLRERFERVSGWLAYPYGLSSPAVERAAAEAGYRAAVRVSGGWLPAGTPDRFALPRFNVPAGLSCEGFLLRTAGLLRA